MRVLFRNAFLYDPKTKLEGIGDILSVHGRIEKIGANLSSHGASEIHDLKGLMLVPGFIDIHVHFREPGDEHKETIETGSRAAAAGGFSTVCMMPNTNPANDSVFVTSFMNEKVRENSFVRAHPIGALSKNLEGREMSEYGRLLEAGCVAFSDDGKCVNDAYFARKAMEYLKDLQVPYIEHCEECRLAHGGVMNEGPTSFELGVQGIPNASEDVIVERNISLARLTHCHVHMAHLSSRHSVQGLRDAQKEGLRCTGEVTPHHLLFNDTFLKGMDVNYKMAPPLRSEEDRRALVQGLQEGVIQAIATDHAPHSLKEKGVEFSNAANGVIGLESAFSACMILVGRGELGFSRLVESFTSGPAEIMGFQDRGLLKEGLLADFTVLDREKAWIFAADHVFSKSRNSPFFGMEFKGQVTKTIVGGEIVYDRMTNQFRKPECLKKVNS